MLIREMRDIVSISNVILHYKSQKILGYRAVLDKISDLLVKNMD